MDTLLNTSRWSTTTRTPLQPASPTSTPRLAPLAIYRVQQRARSRRAAKSPRAAPTARSASARVTALRGRALDRIDAAKAARHSDHHRRHARASRSADPGRPAGPRPLPVITVDEPSMTLIGVDLYVAQADKLSHARLTADDRQRLDPRARHRAPGRVGVHGRGELRLTILVEYVRRGLRADRRQATGRRSAVDGMRAPVERMTIDVPEYVGVDHAGVLRPAQGPHERDRDHGTGWEQPDRLPRHQRPDRLPHRVPHRHAAPACCTTSSSAGHRARHAPAPTSSIVADRQDRQLALNLRRGIVDQQDLRGHDRGGARQEDLDVDAVEESA